jgi:hypothetical protein
MQTLRSSRCAEKSPLLSCSKKKKLDTKSPSPPSLVHLLFGSGTTQGNINPSLQAIRPKQTQSTPDPLATPIFISRCILFDARHLSSCLLAQRHCGTSTSALAVPAHGREKQGREGVNHSSVYSQNNSLTIGFGEDPPPTTRVCTTSHAPHTMLVDSGETREAPSDRSR